VIVDASTMPNHFAEMQKVRIRSVDTKESTGKELASLIVIPSSDVGGDLSYS